MSYIDDRKAQLQEDTRNYIASRNMDHTIISLQELQGKTKPGSEHPEEDLEQLSAGSIEARINAEDLQVAVGTQTVAVQIQVPSNPRVFAIGTYTVTCNITSR